VHTVHAEDDGHPLAVYTVKEEEEEEEEEEEYYGPSSRDGNDCYDGCDDEDYDGRRKRQRPRTTPVLLLHGRTWSSVPVYHLLAPPPTKRNDDDYDGRLPLGGGGGGGGEDDGEDRSLLRALRDYSHRRASPYAMDFRGFGGTPRDGSGYAEPSRCAKDAASVLNWIRKREEEERLRRIRRSRRGRDDDDDGGGDGIGGGAGEWGGEAPRPALLGWSHGALIAQIVAQRHPDSLSKLIL
jgi:pimeloyl-ACP methyl ester carboxylesterase